MRVKEMALEASIEDTRGDEMSAIDEQDYLMWLLELAMNDVCNNCGYALEGSKAKWDYEMQSMQERVWRKSTGKKTDELPF